MNHLWWLLNCNHPSGRRPFLNVPKACVGTSRCPTYTDRAVPLIGWLFGAAQTFRIILPEICVHSHVRGRISRRRVWASIQTVLQSAEILHRGHSGVRGDRIKARLTVLTLMLHSRTISPSSTPPEPTWLQADISQGPVCIS